MSKTMRARTASVHTVAALIAASLISIPASAAGLSYAFNDTFSDGSVAPDGSDYAFLSLDDGGVAGSVELTISLAPTIGAADMTGLYLNLDPAFDAADLSFTRLSGTGPDAGDITITADNDASKAGGSGLYDIWFRFTNNTFSAGESLTYLVDGIDSLTVSSFEYLSVNPGGNGPFGAVGRFQSTGGGRESAWTTGDAVGFQSTTSVPVPAAVWLLGSALGFLGWKGRRSIAQQV